MDMKNKVRIDYNEDLYDDSDNKSPSSIPETENGLGTSRFIPSTTHKKMRAMVKNKDENNKLTILNKTTVWISAIGGIISILLGFGFLFKYAFENDIISETGLIITGLITGCVFLVAGNYLRNKYEKFYIFIVGGGFGLLYLSLFSAYGMYALMGSTITLLAVSVVTITGVLLSLRYNSQGISGISLLGGYLTPILVWFDKASVFSIYLYLLLITLLFTFLARYKKWKIIIGMSALGSFALPIALDLIIDNAYQTYLYITLVALGVSLSSHLKNWYYLISGFVFGNFILLINSLYVNYFTFNVNKIEPKTIWVSAAITSILAAIYTILIISKTIKNNADHTNHFDFIIMSIAGLVSLFTSYQILLEPYPNYISLVPMTYAVLYTLLAVALAKNKISYKKHAFLYTVALAVASLNLTLFAQFENITLTLLLLFEVLLLVVLAFSVHSAYLLNISITVWLLAVFDFIAQDYLSQSYNELVFNKRFILCIGFIITGAVLAYISNKMKKHNVYLIFSVITWLGVMLIVPMELSLAKRLRYIDTQIFTFLLSAIYMAIALTTLGLGKIFKSLKMYVAAGVTIFFIITKTFLYDILLLEGVVRIVAFIVLGFVLLGVGLFYSRNAESIKRFIK